MSYLRMLDRIGTIVNPTGSSVDADGRVSRTNENVSTPYKLDQLSAAERDLAQVQDAAWRLFLPAGKPITAASSFIDADNRAYQVVGTPDRLRFRGREHHVEVLLASTSGVDA